MIDTTQDCGWLHSVLEAVPLITYPFSIESLPDNGIYFFYEKGELNGHSVDKPRIVRVGTHKNGNFKSRISDHFLPKGMRLDKNKPAPKDRSIFRKNLGRAILNKIRPDYLTIWELDFTTRETLDKYLNKRDLALEQEIEEKITEILRNNFGFKYIVIEDQKERMGSSGLESRLIGTLSHCSICGASPSWLGKYSPIKKIKERGLWLVQHLSSPGISEADKEVIQGRQEGRRGEVVKNTMARQSQNSGKTQVREIVKAIDDHLEKSGLEYVTPVEANAILENMDILPDNQSRPGLPLRVILRNGDIPHAYQSTGGKNGRWFIPHS